MQLKKTSLLEAREKMLRLEERYVGQDPLKLGIEPNIRPVVAVLIAHGFPTQNSCEGHIESNLYPWVRFQPPTTKRTKQELRAHVRRIHFEVEQLTELLAEYWQTQPEISTDRQLVASMEWDPSTTPDAAVIEQYLDTRAKRFVALPGYWLRCVGAEVLTTLPDEIIRPHRKAILKNRREDMRAFGGFLVTKL